MRKLRVGVVGGGHLGKIHLRLLAEHDHIEPVLLVETHEQARQALQDETDIATSGHLQDLVRLKADAAIVATPSHTHQRIACELLEQGLHVFVEKPLAISAKEAQQIVRTAMFSGRVLQVGHVERFNPAFVAALPYLKDPSYIDAVRASNYSMRSTDIGVVLDLMVHDIDLVLSVVGAPVARIDATGQTVVGPHEDIAEARLTFENGCVAHLKASRVSRDRTRQMNVRMGSDSIHIDFDGPSAVLQRQSPELRSLASTIPQLSPHDRTQLAQRFLDCYLPQQELPTRPANAILNEQRDFFSAILRDGTPQVTGQAGAGAVAIAEQIREQIQQQEQRLRRPLQPFYGPHWDARKAG